VIILGVDPGLSATGYGIIEKKGSRITPLEWGVIRSKPGALADRLAQIYHRLSEIIDRYSPITVAVEEIFTGRNPRSALLLGHARGVALFAGSAHSCSVYEYPARSVKQAVVGRGSATKAQVKFMVRKLLAIEDTVIALDASDALAVALCCLFREGDARLSPGAASAIRNA